MASFLRSLPTVLMVLMGACHSLPATLTTSTHGHLRVAGRGLQSIDFDVGALEATGSARDVTWSHHAETHVYRCVPLHQLLVLAGLEPGSGGPGADPRSKHSGWRRVVRARAADGFDALFSSAELAPEIGPSVVLVAWSRDGEPLDGNEGPYRLLVLTDKKGSRSVRRLVHVEVMDLTAVGAP